MINWQLSKQGIRWPVSPDRSAGSIVDPSRSSYALTNYQFEMIAGSSLFFQGFISNMLCLCHYVPALLGFWFQTEAKIQPVFFKVQAGKTLSYHGHALVTLYVQFLYSDWSKFDSWVHAKKLCSILKIVYFDSWSWRVLCQLVMFLTVFFHWMYKMKYSCYQESSVIHGWFVYWVFGWETRRLSKFGNSISDGIVFVFHLS